MWIKKFAVPVPLGLVERQAAGYRARFDRWPPGYMAFSMKHCRGVIPQRVTDLVERLRRTRPWERCSHGVDLSPEAGDGFCGDCYVEWSKTT